MLQPKGDPFFAELKAEIQYALDESARGEALNEEHVWANLHAIVDCAMKERNLGAGDP